MLITLLLIPVLLVLVIRMLITLLLIPVLLVLVIRVLITLLLISTPLVSLVLMLMLLTSFLFIARLQVSPLRIPRPVLPILLLVQKASPSMLLILTPNRWGLVPLLPLPRLLRTTWSTRTRLGPE
jgi:hypothetical protein